MKSNTRQDYLDRICRVLRFVQEHLDEDLSPAILSDVANLSVYHFDRVFSGLVGESPGRARPAPAARASRR
jgi:AraC family transcriptional regulator